VTVAEAREEVDEITAWSFNAKANSNIQLLKDSSRPIPKENKKKQGKKKSRKHRRRGN
jgi:hypothetical protein